MVSKNFNFKQFAAANAWLAGVSAFLYSLTFYWADKGDSQTAGTLNQLFLMLGGLFAIAVLIRLYNSLREGAGEFATWAVVLGIFGLIGSMIHGGFGLASSITPTSDLNSISGVDPRGLLTFGLTGVSVLTFGFLMHQTKKYEPAVFWLGKLLGVLLIAIYILRLVSPDGAATATKDLAAVAGFIVAPSWYISLAQAFSK